MRLRSRLPIGSRGPIGRSLAIACGLLLGVGTVLHGDDLRPMTPDDLFNLEEFADVAFSPDGQTVAYVHQRPLSSSRSFPHFFLQGSDRGDIWIAPAAGGVPTNVTNGEASDAGFWSPRWSPDGERLALLSTKDGNIHLWIWERTGSRLRKLSDFGVSVRSGEGLAFTWIDDRRIAAILLPHGEQPLVLSANQLGGRHAMEAWEKAWVRRESSASALESGIPRDLTHRPHETLTVLDVTGAKPPTTLGAAPSIMYPRLSPDGRHIAFMKHAATWQPTGADQLPDDGDVERFQLAIADLDGRPIVLKKASPESPESPEYVRPATFRWSPDGQAYAFLARHAEDDEPGVVIRGALNGSTFRVSLPEVSPLAVEWVGHGRLLVNGERKSSGRGARSRRRDWWLVSPGTIARNLTESLNPAPAQLFAHGAAQVVTGISGSDAWQRRLDTNKWTLLTAPRGTNVTGLAWPSLHRDVPRNLTRIVLSVRKDRGSAFARLDLDSGDLTPLPDLPSEHATLAAYDPGSDRMIFTADERDGTFITAARGGERHTLAVANTFLTTIADAEARAIEYRGLDGKPLKAWLLLPVNYRTGTRYPLVTWVYVGDMAGEQPPAFTRLNYTSWMNLQLLAARGYAVLVPSMPLPPDPIAGGPPSDPYFELTKGVLPAVDKAIELGVADPERLALMGHSFGGFSVYGLVSQTNQFKAGIALAGLSDLSSLYGTFDVRLRYSPHLYEWLSTPWLLERMAVRMGTAPWQDAARYARNSPLSYIDRVRTPLLILQGEMDYIAMTQGEQLFTALYRQGKRARFVRYWGEGHVLVSPANIKDAWSRIVDWLAECLAPAS